MSIHTPNESSMDNLVVTASSRDLNAIFEQAVDEQWAELILLGPKLSSLYSVRLKHGSLEDAKHIYRCGDFSLTTFSLFSSLTNLTSLDVMGNSIGVEGVWAISNLKT